MRDTQSHHQLVDSETGRVVVQHLEIADTIWSRFRGWMFKRQTQASVAILIRPCGSVHTMWMRMTIDLFFLSQDNQVVGIRKALSPWRIAIAPKGIFAVLEAPTGQCNIPIGMTLRIEAVKR